MQASERCDIVAFTSNRLVATTCERLGIEGAECPTITSEVAAGAPRQPRSCLALVGASADQVAILDQARPTLSGKPPAEDRVHRSGG